MVLVSWAHARINWSIRLHLRPFLRKDERENNANVLDIYSGGTERRCAQRSPRSSHTYIYRKWEPIDTRKFGFDFSVPPSSRTPVQTLGAGKKTQYREGSLRRVRCVPFRRKINGFRGNRRSCSSENIDWSFFLFGKIFGINFLWSHSMQGQPSPPPGQYFYRWIYKWKPQHLTYE